jgi:hypothetical protein
MLFEFATDVLTFRGWTDFGPSTKKLAQIRIIMIMIMIIIIIIISQFLTKLFSHKNVRYDENEISL